MKTIIVRANQDVYDICVQEYGSVEFYGKLVVDNGLNMAGDISQGHEKYHSSRWHWNRIYA